MRKSSISLALYLLAVFASGILVGAFGHKLYTVRSVNAAVDQRGQKPARMTPEQFRAHYVQELRSRLNLNDEQLAKLNTILDDTHAKFRAMRERHRPEAEQIKEDQRAQIRAMLDASQQPEYQRILEEHDQKRREHEKRRP